MNSEKVKEIKKVLEQNDDNGIMYEVNDQKRTCKFIHHKDIITLINELESEKDNLYNLNQNLISDKQVLMQENERLRNDKWDCQDDLEWYHEENQTLRHQIAELEKENKEQLKRFAERLIEKKVKLGERFNIYDIDETLKEFLGVEE